MLRWEDNIKMYLKEITFKDVDSIQLVQGRVQWQQGNIFLMDVESFHYLSDYQLLKKLLK
jgi:hypothetical protein